jgi:hypothetical protein
MLVELEQQHPHHQGVAIEQVHEPDELGVVAVEAQTQVTDDRLAVGPALFTLEPTQR